YNLCIIGIPRTAREPGRGGSRNAAFRWSHADQAAPPTAAGILSEDENWERLDHSLGPLVPLATGAKVRRACPPHHPYTPPRYRRSLHADARSRPPDRRQRPPGWRLRLLLRLHPSAARRARPAAVTAPDRPRCARSGARQVRTALMAIKEVCLHQPPALDLLRPAGLEAERVAQRLAGRGGDVNVAG